MDSHSKSILSLSGLLSFSLNTWTISSKLISGSTLYLGKNANNFLYFFFFYHVHVTRPPAHLQFKVGDSHFNQEHKMFELQRVIERLTVLFDNGGSHQFKTKLGAKCLSEIDKTKCMSSSHLFNFLSFAFI